jgi:molecular chaperone DnaJ
MPKDYYIVLGVSRSADARKIKKAYRTVAKRYHPDVSQSPESKQRFQEIRDAYETLADEGKRRRYDAELARKGSSLRITKFPETVERRRSVFDEMDSVLSPVDEFFSGFLPGFFDRQRRMEKDLYLEAILSPGEASRGGLFPVTVPVIEPCLRCSKSGI